MNHGTVQMFGGGGLKPLQLTVKNDGYGDGHSGGNYYSTSTSSFDNPGYKTVTMIKCFSGQTIETKINDNTVLSLNIPYNISNLTNISIAVGIIGARDGSVAFGGGYSVLLFK